MTTERRGRTRGTSRTSAGSGRSLVIVESPAKARTIAQFLGANYIVEPSIGHIRDLPSSAAEIPAAVKGQPWARLGVDVEHGFKPLYVVPARQKPQVKKLRDLVREADAVYLATDEDREGEAIAWHLAEVLEPKVPVQRMVFHEITRSAIEEALAHPRELDRNLVEAQEARRILDRLYGYEVSPVLWRKIRPRLSAGRVQSAALRLIIEREQARMQFVSASFWDVEAQLEATPATPTVSAELVELGGKRVASGRDFDAATGRLTGDARLLDQAAATAVADVTSRAPFRVASVHDRPFTQRPPAPFITSSLQQEAARKLRFSAQRTMQVAQQLYENGYITYMRTDSTTLSEQALSAARRQVTELYGETYLPPAPRRYAGKAKGAQEAHEAIRPAGDIFRTPDNLARELDGDAARLYDLIWKRTVASQMRDASGLRTTVRIEVEAGAEGTAVFSASGKVITFAGFLRAYVEGSDDPEADLEDQERLLPPLAEGQSLKPLSVTPRGHETQAPPRFTEASLIRELEQRGIGRPSTYAATLQTIQDRGYVWKRGTALIPTFVAFAVVNLLRRHFPELIDLDFTARMEQDLDTIAAGAIEATPWLHRFYFGHDHDADGNRVAPDTDLLREGLRDRIGSGWEAIDARAISSIPIGTDEAGREIAVRVGRYGPYLQAGDDEPRANIPEDLPPDELTVAYALDLLRQAAQGDQPLGTDPESGHPIYLKTGRYGPYVQLGEDDSNTGGDGKPRRSSLWPGMTPETLTLEQARLLLSYPRVLGTRPDSGDEVVVLNGPRGPYIRSGSESRSLSGYEQLQTITLDEAIELLAQPVQRRGRGEPQVLASLGPDPGNGRPIEVKSGRFGPYVTDGDVNASLPRGLQPESLSLDHALELLAARRARIAQGDGTSPGGRRSPGRARTTPKPPRARGERRSA